MEWLEIEIAKSKMNDFQCELSESFLFFFIADTNSSINLRCVDRRLNKLLYFSYYLYILEFYCILYRFLLERNAGQQTTEQK